jgi:hypothetical protein
VKQKKIPKEPEVEAPVETQEDQQQPEEQKEEPAAMKQKKQKKFLKRKKVYDPNEAIEKE